MVDRLKQSVEDLEAPDCDNCKVKMKWYSAHLLASTANKIAYFFYCPSCSRIKEVIKDHQADEGNGQPPPIKHMLPGRCCIAPSRDSRAA